jgi:segregation and condensation protein A
MNETSPEYEVQLELFQGPLDLLLHLIRKNEVDIFDIPIAEITDQYLEYLDMLKAFNLNVAGDFLVMAATLIHIKSKMLLPKSDDGVEDEEDPRLEITRPLMEYLQLKNVAEELSDRERLDRDIFIRRMTDEFRDQLQNEESLLEVNLFQLIDAFKAVLDRKLPGVQLSFTRASWSVKEKTAHIMERLRETKSIYFVDLFEGDKVIGEFIATFLALLELVHRGLVRIFQPDPGKDILLEGIFNKQEENNGV